MKKFAFLTGLSQRFASLRRDQKGVSAVEFAMLLPLMITLYLGAVEISQGVGIDRKVTLTARTVADLASQVSSINNADMTNMLNASAAVIAPFTAGQLKVTVSAVTIDAQRHRQGHLERHAQRHQARGRIRPCRCRAALNVAELAADLERGVATTTCRPSAMWSPARSICSTRSTCGRGCPTRSPRQSATESAGMLGLTESAAPSSP